MPLQFTKMHGLGNDFVIVSLFDQVVDKPAELARLINDRRRGIGADGLILMAPATAADSDVRMEVYNADGSRAGMCGNGLRCAARWAYENGHVQNNPMRINTDAGVLTAELRFDANDNIQAVRTDLGAPILSPQKIPVALSGERVVGVMVPLPEAMLQVTCVSLGNPHAVFFEHLDDVPLAQWGPLIERHPLFPERTNVHFVQVLDRTHVCILHWERGCGATQACGTGAGATCVAGVLNNLTDRAITAEMPGGALQLEWEESSDHVFQTGPAEEVFTGQLSGGFAR
ncbi:MAG: diaminopimelate epimerase [Planctomycetota bacterium]